MELGTLLEVILQLSLLCWRGVYVSLSVPLHLFLDHLCILMCELPKRRGRRRRNPEVKLNQTPALIILVVSLNR